MDQPLSRKERSDHLLQVITSQRFLTKQGLGNEVPFFICPYPAVEGLSMDDDRKDLVVRIEHSGVNVLDINLYDLTLKILEDRGILEQVLEVEVETDKSELKGH